jgi:hypothetical protein
MQLACGLLANVEVVAEDVQQSCSRAVSAGRNRSSAVHVIRLLHGYLSKSAAVRILSYHPRVLSYPIILPERRVRYQR